MFPIAFAGHEWARGHRKKYGDTPSLRVQILTWISTYLISVVMVVIISFIYYQHFTDITAIQFIRLILEIKYTLFLLSFMIYFSLFWSGVAFFDSDKLSEAYRCIVINIAQWFGNDTKGQLITIGCVSLVVGIAIYLRWFYYIYPILTM